MKAMTKRTRPLVLFSNIFLNITTVKSVAKINTIFYAKTIEPVYIGASRSFWVGSGSPLEPGLAGVVPAFFY